LPGADSGVLLKTSMDQRCGPMMGLTLQAPPVNRHQRAREP
jgi:hypothetical protein